MKTQDKSTLNTPEGLLVRIKTKLCLALGINTPTMRILIDRFVNQHYDRNSVKTHFTKVNLYNELNADKMTIKKFINDFLRIIQVSKFKLTVTVTTVRGKEVTVTEEVVLMAQESPIKEENHDDKQ